MRRHPRPSATTTTRTGAATVRVVAVLALSILLPVMPAHASWRARADSLFAEADLRFSRGNYGDAVGFYARTINTIESNAGASPASYFVDLAARARFLMARSHENLEEWEPALVGYSLSLTELSEVEDLVRLRLAACHEGMGERDLATEELRTIIDDGVDNAFDLPAMLELAGRYEETDDFDMALQWYRL
ncbi:MAG: hypothetical protein KAW67_09435, partial [Candidatus Eisenbacteria sp.]|nr:hypothetical protein [Candidatus Eisenbacteria bacterium]